jgi:hypothetical protein
MINSSTANGTYFTAAPSFLSTKKVDGAIACIHVARGTMLPWIALLSAPTSPFITNIPNACFEPFPSLEPLINNRVTKSMSLFFRFNLFFQEILS